MIKDTLPDDVAFVGYRDLDTGESCTRDGREITCTFASVPIGESRDVEFVVEPEDEGEITNRARVYDNAAAVTAGTPDATITIETDVQANDPTTSPSPAPSPSPSPSPSPIDDFIPPGVFDDFSPNDDFFDDNEDEDDLAQAEEDLAEAEEDLAEAETTTGEGTTGNDGGAFAESGDPDDQPPVSGQPGDVVDEIDTGGQELPNTPGFSIIAVIIESIICATALVTFWALAVRKANP